MKEQILGVVDSSEGHRVLLVLRERQVKPFELRTESFSADVGWFSQQSLELTRAELSGLKNVLGLQLPSACRATQQGIQTAESSDQPPAILSFASAAKRA